MESEELSLPAVRCIVWLDPSAHELSEFNDYRL